MENNVRNMRLVSAWVTILAIVLSAWTVAAGAQTVTTYQVIQTDPSHPTTSFGTGLNRIGLAFYVSDLPVSSTARMRILRPDNSAAADVSFSLSDTALASSYWWYVWDTTLDVAGTWHIALDINSSTKVTTPFYVTNHAKLTNEYVIDSTFQRASAFVTGTQLVGLYWTMTDLAAGSSFRFRYIRPNGTVAADATWSPGYGYFHDAVLEALWWVTLDVTGTWKLELLINGLSVSVLPFAVEDEISPDQVTLIDTRGKSVVGMVCDNLRWPVPQNPDDDHEDYDRLVLHLPDGARVTGFEPAKGASASSGFLAQDSSQSKLVYYPPDEFNENQEPNGVVGDAITPASTRDVVVTVHFLTAEGPRIVHKKVVLARPPVVLVHGIRSSPENWGPLVYSTQNPEVGRGIRVPFATVDHSGAYGGDGPVESAALLLARTVGDTIARIRAGIPLPNGTASKSFDVVTQTFGYDWSDFTDYSDVGKLACKRVDVVAWSYGGVITRWYISSDGSNPSAPNDTVKRWYNRRYADAPIPSEAETLTYHGDIRKVVTLGSMWRGVPLANYLNEILFSDIFPTTQPPFSQAKTASSILFGDTMHDFVDLRLNVPFFPCYVPAMEVMAVDSSWMQWMIYRDNTVVGPLPPAHPFDDKISYGSIAGDDKRYPLAPITVGPLGTGDIYATVDKIQQPSWFPYLPLEQLPNSFLENSHNYSDGLVPLWSAAIPNSYKILSVTHNAYSSDGQTRDTLLQWLNSADVAPSHKSLKLGLDLSASWNDDVVQDSDPTAEKRWSFRPGFMAPYPQYDFYVRQKGIGRIDPQAIGGSGPRLQVSGAVVVSRNQQTVTIDATIVNLGKVMAPDVKVISATLKCGGNTYPDIVLKRLLTIRPGKLATVRLVFDGVIAPSGDVGAVQVSGTSLFPDSQVTGPPVKVRLP
jgi:pimeloyl-ACP methyl ester carboxylesterase